MISTVDPEARHGHKSKRLPGLRRARVDLLRPRLDVTASIVEVRGVLLTAGPKTRAGRRQVPLPRPWPTRSPSTPSALSRRNPTPCCSPAVTAAHWGPGLERPALGRGRPKPASGHQLVGPLIGDPEDPPDVA